MLKLTSSLRCINLQASSKIFIRNAYKSIYNPEVLYPGSSKIGADSSTLADGNSEKFSGFIPVEKLHIKYSRSSGPGGQHVNKTESKAQVRFHVASATWIPENSRMKLCEKYERRITKDGELIVQCDTSRYQINNLQTCITKIKEMIEEVEKPPDMTKVKAMEELNNEESLEKANTKRLKKKKSSSYTKNMRNIGNYFQ